MEKGQFELPQIALFAITVTKSFFLLLVYRIVQFFTRFKLHYVFSANLNTLAALRVTTSACFAF